MKALILTLMLALCISFASAQKNEDNGRKSSFLTLVPRIFSTDSCNKVYLTLFGVDSPGYVEINLVNNNTGKTVAYNSYDLDEDTMSTALSIDIPDVKPYQDYRFKIDGKFTDGYTISGEVKVDVRSQSGKIIFIQTDKPFYKPGQKVLFRVLPLDRNLKPLDEEALFDVYVQQPTGARVFQEKNVPVGGGIKQFELPLSDEPVMGFWTITANVSGTEQTQSFEVKEYVLPKLDVNIQIPPYVLATDRTVPITVCANYTYGKKVQGTLQLNISQQNYYYYSGSEFDKVPTIRQKVDLNGCFNYVLNVSLVDDSCCQNIRVSAEVFEKGTGVSKTASAPVSRTQNPLNLNFQTSSYDYIKPGLPYYGELKVTRPDNTPAADEPISICMTASRERVVDEWLATQKKKYCRNYTSGLDGIVRYTISPRPTDITSISLEAKSLAYGLDNDYSNGNRLYQPNAYGSLKSFYSPSGSFIQIQQIEDSLPCDSKQQISILYTCKKEGKHTLFYQIITARKVFKKQSVTINCNKDSYIPSGCYPNDVTSQGNATLIVPDPGNTQPNRGDCDCLKDSNYVPYIAKQDISVGVSSKLSQSFTVVAFYVRHDREVVADTQQFTVDKCLPNKVTLEFGDESKKPGTDTTLSLTTSPNSLCGVRVVDKSVVLLDSSGPLTLDEIFNRIQDYRPTYTVNHCSGDDKRQPGLPAAMSRYGPLPPRPIEYSTSPYDDSYSAFELAGFFAVSDLRLLSRPCRTEIDDSPRAYPLFAARANQPRARVSAKRVSSKARLPAMDAAPAAEDTSAVSAVDIRTYFPDTWLFKLQAVGNDGELTTHETLPDTITEWVGSAICVNPDEGLGISNEARIKGFQPFFISLTLPYSIVRGEKLPVIVSVFSYLQKCLPVSITLQSSDDFVLLSNSYDVDVCLCPNDSSSQRFYVTSNIIGQLNFTISAVKAANSDICGSADIHEGPARDALTNSIIVEAEGFPYEKVLTYFFFPKDEDNGVYVQTIPYDLPEDYVSDSGRGFFSLTGDILGPAIQNIRSIITLPTGCGEQNIAKFLPIVYVLDYLVGTGEITKETKDDAISYLQQGYQSQMRFKRYDNSYSAFGGIDQEGSIFLTAFVIRAFSEASRYIAIDQSDLQKSIDYVLSKQDEKGCFPVIGQTFSAEIKGGPLTNTTSSITAYILMSLLTADAVNDTVYQRAVSCIISGGDTTPYQNALFAYTFALANNVKRANYYRSELYTTADETGDKTQWYFGPKTVRTEIAAYAVLTNIKLGRPVTDSLPIVRYLNTVRNRYGGFTSSQDTVIGLKALSEFAPLITTKNLNVNVTTSGILEKSLSVTSENRLLLRTEKVSEVPGRIDVQASGTGGAMIQATVRANTNAPFQDKYFSLDVTPDADNDDCEFEDINVCTSYLPTAKKSNMALLEIKMVSGVVPMKETLQKLKATESLNIKRFDFTNNNLVLYFDQLTNDKKCFKFTVQRVVNVQDLKPATAKVYDYYAPEFKQEAVYSLKDCN